LKLRKREKTMPPRKRELFTIQAIQATMVTCRECPRLVEWREKVALEKVARFQSENYWGKPVPSWGDDRARHLIVGLAPAAHGGNRTGRIFTGDRSGDWLYRALYKTGFANQPNSTHQEDGLHLIDCYITAVLHCAPPLNKPLPEEILHCRPFLLQEKDLLKNIRVITALGRLAFDTTWALFKPAGKIKRPVFSHGVEVELGPALTLLGSFHPSQQNTFTGRLTEAMLDQVFERARTLIYLEPGVVSRSSAADAKRRRK
jgi:uracil-DNA glycosylase